MRLETESLKSCNPQIHNSFYILGKILKTFHGLLHYHGVFHFLSVVTTNNSFNLFKLNLIYVHQHSSLSLSHFILFSSQPLSFLSNHVKFFFHFCFVYFPSLVLPPFISPPYEPTCRVVDHRFLNMQLHLCQTVLSPCQTKQTDCIFSSG